METSLKLEEKTGMESSFSEIDKNGLFSPKVEDFKVQDHTGDNNVEAEIDTLTPFMCDLCWKGFPDFQTWQLHTHNEITEEDKEAIAKRKSHLETSVVIADDGKKNKENPEGDDMAELIRNQLLVKSKGPADAGKLEILEEVLGAKEPKKDVVDTSSNKVFKVPSEVKVKKDESIQKPQPKKKRVRKRKSCTSEEQLETPLSAQNTQNVKQKGAVSKTLARRWGCRRCAHVSRSLSEARQHCFSHRGRSVTQPADNELELTPETVEVQCGDCDERIQPEGGGEEGEGEEGRNDCRKRKHSRETRSCPVSHQRTEPPPTVLEARSQAASPRVKRACRTQPPRNCSRSHTRVGDEEQTTPTKNSTPTHTR